MRNFLFALALTLSCAATTRAQEATPTPAVGAGVAPAAAAAGQAERDASRTPGAIKGRVVEESGRPVPNIVLSTNGRNAAGVPTRVSAVSDEAGNFSLDGLDPGLYPLSVQTNHYTLARDPATGAYGDGPHRVGDFATVRLARGGVITGTVTDADGEPLVAVAVRAFFVRELDAPPGQSPLFINAREFETDDRGVYRIYGLRAGRYVVAAGGTPQFRSPDPSPYELDATAYHPSATRDDAVEIVVRSGQESAGVDIRQRGVGGRSVSGTLEGAFGGDAGQGGGGAQAMLVHAATGTMQGQTFVAGQEGRNSFNFVGVPDGEYELLARRFSAASAASAPLKVSVRGADVTGLRLTLTPSASVGGALVLEPLPRAEREGVACTDGRALFPEEIYVLVLRDHSDSAKGQARTRLGSQGGSAVPDASGAFNVRGLDPGRYRFQVRPGSEDWYVRSVSLRPTPAPPRAASAKTPPTPPAPQDFLQLAAGQGASGVTIRIAEGAAGLRGRVAPAPAPPAAGEAARPALPARLQVHLVPAAPERADDQLFFHETAVNPDKSFSLRNVAPGRYFLLARPARETGPELGAPRPSAWDAAERAALRREAESARTTIELTTCQRVNDFTLLFPPQIKDK